MDVSFSPDLEQFIEAEISAGHYASVQDLLGDALRMLKIQVQAPRKGVLDDLILEGMQDARAGRLHDGEAVFAELDRMIDKIEREQLQGK